jgi:hypothetical protein
VSATGRRAENSASTNPPIPARMMAILPLNLTEDPREENRSMMSETIGEGSLQESARVRG